MMKPFKLRQRRKKKGQYNFSRFRHGFSVDEGMTPASTPESLDTATKTERKKAVLKENIEAVMEFVDEAKTAEDLSDRGH
eukprot:scaffold3241_cov125-Cylindrotheca_fusiformis.AAC.2